MTNKCNKILNGMSIECNEHVQKLKKKAKMAIFFSTDLFCRGTRRQMLFGHTRCRKALCNLASFYFSTFISGRLI